MRASFWHSTWGSLLLLFLLTFVCAVVGSLLTIPIIAAGGAGNPTVLRISQLISTLTFMLLPAVIYGLLPSVIYGNLRKGSSLKEELGLRPTSDRWLVIGLVLGLAIPISAFFSWINSFIPLTESMRAMEERAQEVTQQLIYVDCPRLFLFNVLVISVAPAISEEVFFRGVLQPIFTRRFSPHVSVWLAAIVFSSIHLQFAGFLPRLGLGLMLGYLALYSGSIWPSVVMHGVNNLVAVVVYFIMARYDIPYEDPTENSLFVIIVGGMMAVLVAWWIARRFQLARPLRRVEGKPAESAE